LPCVAVCCSMLQYVAVCCSILQCIAVYCSVLQCVAVCCSVLQCVAVCCSVLQCVAVCCCAFNLASSFRLEMFKGNTLQKTPFAYNIFFQKTPFAYKRPSSKDPFRLKYIFCRVKYMALYLTRVFFCGAQSAAAQGWHQVARHIHNPNGAHSASPLAPESVAAIGNECLWSIASSPLHCNHKYIVHNPIFL